MGVAVWLRSLGLGKYEAIFRENDIDETVLPEPDAREPEGAWLRVVWAPCKAARCHCCSADAGSKPPSADVTTTSSCKSACKKDPFSG